MQRTAALVAVLICFTSSACAQEIAAAKNAYELEVESVRAENAKRQSQFLEEKAKYDADRKAFLAAKDEYAASQQLALARVFLTESAEARFQRQGPDPGRTRLIAQYRCKCCGAEWERTGSQQVEDFDRA